MFHYKHPFGEASCEDEVKVLKDEYEKYYFEETPFNKATLEDDCYLIIGRRGTGKSSLAHYFTFQDEIKNARCIDIDEPEVFSNVLKQVSKFSDPDATIAIPRIVKIWNFIFWSLIFSKYRDYSPEISAACLSKDSKGSFFIRSILKHILEKFLPQDAEQLSESLEDFLSSKTHELAKNKMLSIAKDEPVVVAMDSLEKYSVDNIDVMNSLAALIQCSSNFNIEYSGKGIHVKTFVSAEVFPYLTESAMSNTVKYVRHPVYMHWRPKDLMRLVSWRFYTHMEKNGIEPMASGKVVKWTNFHDVLDKVWIPHFGESITNGTGIAEKTFPYILRHTQMRPRQIVVLCNAIARNAIKEKVYPDFKSLPRDMISIVKETAITLANGVINSYSTVYPNVNKILDALSGVPNVFEGKYLDRIAQRTASEWPNGEYSRTRFKQIISELGIVGVIRKRNETSHIIEADFEYTIKDRLAITAEDKCVIHPMFYEKFRIEIAEKVVVYPFPDNAEFQYAF
ncbi:P-loop ATPase, Sll1717 family [Paraglaciecola chathamensis]|jgi:hypothetical protein|uniref:Uncharacterized protein n=2 Tax=Paraglaciecola chathamensis TaxID=368405 RepID=A0A8H9IAS5_9ALTE|nr:MULTISPECIES: hypothetical protein [Paraglaciecola]MBN28166.1 hypothetical protein [Alteromonadaceae bacterium]GAC10111.1 hypothetical protein GCHA_2161 [Paraglaciecola chathamensis S18K6]GGZ64303.1 hypothetical protein GCM10011274_23220 [Paraglaciecola oceanifecundans]|tara:strand:+ start:4626 stop:6155 length:1530 start_codon:yes stop_codon:yes gene_type:complete